ncbi:MAG: hypothetical protein M1818_002822 [Claussenomyces sp. TS43310]|nr:MAG: hypothetical protein M1818_002822 [Claussenomyces sp. TS43310]
MCKNLSSLSIPRNPLCPLQWLKTDADVNCSGFPDRKLRVRINSRLKSAGLEAAFAHDAFPWTSAYAKPIIHDAVTKIDLTLLYSIVFDGSDSDSVPQYRPAKEISYDEDIIDNIQTLSTNDADVSDGIKGFLYVPDLNANDPCFHTSQQYIAQNVTRQANLPHSDYNLVALAPWINANCTLSYLASTEDDPTRAFLFYIPDGGTTLPPSIDSEIWDLDDGGQWKSSAQYPVYALPDSIGSNMMNALSLYSGNVSEVPYGQNLSRLGIDPEAYVRICTEITVSTPSSLPGLWVFVLVSFALLAMILALISYFMHFLQRRRRHALRRRVIAGEVNLEALGIKRLTVPKELIERMPLYVYTCIDYHSEVKLVSGSSPAVPNSKVSESITALSNPSALDSADDSHRDAQQSSGSGGVDQSLPRSGAGESNPTPLVVSHEYEPESQPTCPICLDDFESHVTIIRELYCGHIFHPECIDTFLSENSSLCPMCKKSALPTGFCPEKITISMVQRERAIRRLRSQVLVDDDDTVANESWRSRGRRMFMPIFRRGVSPNMESGTHEFQIFHRNTQQHHGSGLSRQEVARMRARELPVLPLEIDSAEGGQDQRPQWRKIIAKVFPGV